MSEVIDAIEIAEGTYWVGKREKASIFHCNPFLRVFKNEEGKAMNLLIDPGSSSDFAVVGAKVRKIIGDLKHLSGVFINHQDPDVGSSAAVILQRYAPKATVLCSEETWRLIASTNIPRNRFTPTNKFRGPIRLGTGHLVLPVPSPFCHFRGAVMLYDLETRVLFTGDLFGALTPADAQGLWAEADDWSGMRAFHQLYMPTNVAIRRTLDTIRNLDPFPEIIAPQHGRLIRGDLIEMFMDRLYKLPVGLDVLAEEDEDTLPAWNAVLDRVCDLASMYLGSHVDISLTDNPDLAETMNFEGQRPRITGLGRWTLSEAVQTITRNEVPEIANPIRIEAMAAAEELGLPTPDLALEEHVEEIDAAELIAVAE